MKSGMKHDVLSGLWSFSRCLPQGMLALNRQVPIQSLGIWYPLKTVAGSECQCCAAGITQGRAIVLPVSTCLSHTKLRIDEQAGCRWFFCCEVHDFQDGVCGVRSIHEDSNFNCAAVDGIALFLESSFPQKVSCLAVSSVNSDEYFPAASAAVSYVASISKSRKWRLSIVAPCCFQTRFFIEAAFKREQQMCKEEGINIDLKFQDESRGGFGFGHYPGQSEISEKMWKKLMLLMLTNVDDDWLGLWSHCLGGVCCRTMSCLFHSLRILRHVFLFETCL